jgi:hypothetical protein
LIHFHRLKMHFCVNMLRRDTDYSLSSCNMDHRPQITPAPCAISLRGYQCKDCLRPHILCATCCVSTHLTSPFHHIQQFNGQYFKCSDLDKLVLVLDLWPHTHDCCTMDCHRDLEEPPGSEHELSKMRRRQCWYSIQSESTIRREYI